MRPFKHINVNSLEEAYSVLNECKGKAKIIAGGTDLLLTLKDSIFPEYPEAVINIKNIPGMADIIEDGDTVKIGSLVTLDHICRSELLRERYPVLAEAAKSVASPQIRNLATVGGNLCQGVRCWYYRYSSKLGGPIKCLRKGNGPCLAVRGDNRYHAITGGKKCFAVCPSDMAVALSALGARVLIAGTGGERLIPVQDLYSPLKLNLEGDEVLKEIDIPVCKCNDSRQNFIKFTLRKPIDYAIVSVASITGFEDGRVCNADIVLGAVAPQPYKAAEAEEFLKGKPLNEEVAAGAAEIALKQVRPLSKNGYKIQIAKNLVKETLLASV